MAIVLSEGAADNRELCYVFAHSLGRPYELFELSESRTAAEVHAALARLEPSQVIVVGELGLEAAEGLSGVDVVYAGVPSRHAGYRRVDALPPFAKQLEYWRSRHPELRSVGVVASPDLRHIVDRLEAAATAAGLEVHRREVASDKEALAAFRFMVPRIDGFFFLPDERVLSPEVIKRVIAHGRRNGVEIAVYSPAMYALGATYLFQADSVDVATQVVALIETEKDSRALTRLRARSRAANSIAFSD